MGWERYLERTRALPVSVAFLLPWVLVYELALLGSRSPVENAAAAWMRAVLRALGQTGLLLASVAAILALVLLLGRRLREAAADRGIFGGMFVEGLAYGALIGAASSFLAGALPMERVVALAAPETTATEALGALTVGVRELGLAVGAGVFEELLFRGAVLGGAVWLLCSAFGTDRLTASVAGCVLAAYLFSDYHHWGHLGEPYEAAVFAFRFHAGLLLGAIYLTRGLGIAAFAHGFYDVLVLLH